MKKWVVMAVLLFFAAAGSATGASLPDSPGAPGATPPDGLAGGRIDYRAKCASCHGANALTTIRTARKLGIDPKRLSLMDNTLTREEMIAITEKGKDKMPGFEKELSRERIAAVIDYVLEFRAKRIKQNSMIRKRVPISSSPAPTETPEKGPEAAP